MSSTQAQKILNVLALIVGVILGSAFGANAATIRVPQNYPTIQDAIVAAADGDTVLVGPGTYVENIDFLSKAISVVSSAGPEVTIIDANNRAGSSVVTIGNTLDRFSIQQVLQGFTLRNGNSEHGGGVAVSWASPAIRGNIFDSYYGVGETITIWSASPLIEQNIFQNIECQYTPGIIQVVNDSSPLIFSNIFINNPCCSISIDLPVGQRPQVVNNTIVGNKVGIYVSDYTDFESTHLYRNNIIVGNQKGLDIDSGFDSSTWQNNLVYGNGTNYSGASDQTGINGNISADPLFLYPANNDYHLCLGSSAIDEGNAAGLDLPATDFDGNPRVIDGQIDIGAYEYDPNAPPRVYITADNVSGAAPLRVQFTSITDRYVTGYLWDFGDGTPGSTEANPVHSFDFGTYTVSLTVLGPTGSGSATRVIESLNAITAFATAGGTITPAGQTPFTQGSSLTYTITPNPCYQLLTLIVDGATVEGPLDYPSTYTFTNLDSDHTITAVFASYLDYFGMQAGNHEESLITYTNGSSSKTQTDDITIDTTTSPVSYIDLQASPGTSAKAWYQIFSNGLSMAQAKDNYSGVTQTFTPPLLMIKTPLAAGAHWSANSSVTDSQYPGVRVKANITAKVSPMTLVNVPAGYFMAWPIAYKLTASAKGRSQATTMTYWFAPYFGTVKAQDSNSMTVMTSFAVGDGTVSFPPPVVTGTEPASGTAESTMTINGYQFGASQGTSTARIGGVDCPVAFWFDRQIQCTVPDTASSGAVTVVTDTWTSNDTVKFTVLPKITEIAPTLGPRGTTVVIMGTNFGAVRRTKGKVKFGKAHAKITQWSDTSITCIVPATMPLGTYSVTVINSQGQSVLPGAFTVVK